MVKSVVKFKKRQIIIEIEKKEKKDFISVVMIQNTIKFKIQQFYFAFCKSQIRARTHTNKPFTLIRHKK